MGKEPIYSFASGQSPLPAEIRESVRADVEARRGGLSVLELPFTCGEARAILHETEAGLRDLLGVPKDYEVLFLQGGAYAQFGILAMNLGGGSRVGAYVEAGHWSRRAVHGCRRKTIPSLPHSMPLTSSVARASRRRSTASF